MNEVVLSKLKGIYDDNTAWLSFAEMKNGICLTVIGILLGGFKDCITDSICKNIFVIFSVIIMLISCISFIPFVNSSKLLVEFARFYYIKTYKNIIESANPIFYVNTFLKGMEGYKDVLRKNFDLLETYEFGILESSYIDQIFSISTITSVKIFIFNFAILLMSILYAFLIVCLVLQI